MKIIPLIFYKHLVAKWNYCLWGLLFWQWGLLFCQWGLLFCLCCKWNLLMRGESLYIANVPVMASILPVNKASILLKKATILPKNALSVIHVLIPLFKFFSHSPSWYFKKIEGYLSRGGMKEGTDFLCHKMLRLK